MAATRGLERGRTDQAAVDRAFAKDLERWLEVQRKAGVDFFSDGQLRWQDMFRPLVSGLGPDPHTLVRWFDTNTFFREPELPEDLSQPVVARAALPDASVPQPRVLTLPSPFVFSRVAKSTAAPDQLMGTLATAILRPTIDAAVASGVRLVHLEEPWLAYEGIDDASWAPLGEALATLHRGLNAAVVLHVYFGNAAPHVARLRRLPIDALGVDLIETDVTALGSDWEIGLGAGLIDGRVSRVEPVAGLVTAARYLAETVRPRELYLTSNSEMSYLPTPVAEEKMRHLGEAARQLKELVAV